MRKNVIANMLIIDVASFVPLTECVLQEHFLKQWLPVAGICGGVQGPAEDVHTTSIRILDSKLKQGMISQAE